MEVNRGRAQGLQVLQVLSWGQAGWGGRGVCVPAMADLGEQRREEAAGEACLWYRRLCQQVCCRLSSHNGPIVPAARQFGGGA